VNYLLDANVLVAWGWSDHVDHERTAAWIAAARKQKATKLMTSAIPELGFVRVSAQRPGSPVTVAEATETLAGMVAALGARHVLLADDQAARKFPEWCSSPSRTTDAHLVDLAEAHGAKLATLDTGIPGAFLIPAKVAKGGRPNAKRIIDRLRSTGIAGVILLAALTMKPRPATAQEGLALPPPAVDLPASQSASEVMVIAGGCFWGVQGVFQHVKGVTNAVSGYAGGTQSTATYEQTSNGTTGHAESVLIIYDPRQVSYGQLLQVFFSVAHDPTQRNRQGPDYGTQYRSTIFAANTEQASVAKAYIAQLDQTRAFRKPIATTIEVGRAFYAAEKYHQDFLVRNPTYPYIVHNDLPKIENLKRLLPAMFQASPVLVSATRERR
jgi:peptide-methionine (S)-S-oxide reductase